ncbi:MAG: 5'-nucleotidase C-terminal domain-containing protein [Aliishimia sp.]
MKSADGVQSTYRTHDIAPSGGDITLSEIVTAQKAEHLAPEDSVVFANIPEALDMYQSVLVATDALRLATDADVAMIGHTTFGSRLASGPMTAYDFGAFVRFGGDVKVAWIKGDVLAQILTRSNPFTVATLDGRTGDYVHVTEFDIDTSATYRLAVNR